MKAIVLTYDRHALITELVLRSYEHHWPDHPFEWYIPYQDFSKMRQIASNPDRIIHFVKTPQPIRSTMDHLLSYTEGKEWVWWCMVDKFVKYADASYLQHIAARVQKLPFSLVGMVTCHAAVRDGQDIFQNLKPRIYQHQFLIAKVLKRLFLSPEIGFQEGDYMPQLEELLDAHRSLLHQKRYITTKNAMLFGETTIAGKITEDCIRACDLYGVEVPDLERTSATIPVGRFPKKSMAKALMLLKQWQKQTESGEVPELSAPPNPSEPLSQSLSQSISVIVCCKGWRKAVQVSVERLAGLFDTQVQPHVDEVIVVDYDCPDKVGKWVKAKGESVVKVVAVPGAKEWNINHARNCGSRFATKNILVFMDADGYPSQVDIGTIRSMSDDLFVTSNDPHSEAIVMHRTDFEEINGFEEGIVGYGRHNTSMIESLRTLGRTEKKLDDYHSVTPDELVDYRAVTDPLPDYWYGKSEVVAKENDMIYEVLRQRHPYKNNVGRNWGLGGC